MSPTDPASPDWWHLLTRLGEAQILLPAAAVAVLALLRRAPGRVLVAWWAGLLALAVALTTASKVAFIGWGLGSPALDFTGISGHAMFAAAVFPLLLGAMVPRLGGGAAPAVAAGIALSLLVGVSRLQVQAHTLSEVVAGLALGGAVSAAVLWRTRLPSVRISAWPALLVLLWFVATPTQAPPSRSHDMVTRLALSLSGHKVPYTRATLHLQRRSARRDASADAV
jgi:membrane-associated phospholipid phosphatase